MPAFHAVYLLTRLERTSPSVQASRAGVRLPIPSAVRSLDSVPLHLARGRPPYEKGQESGISCKHAPGLLSFFALLIAYATICRSSISGRFL